ncbi:MAG: S41 family peptidase, partial [Phycisphaerales bacterium]
MSIRTGLSIGVSLVAVAVAAALGTTLSGMDRAGDYKFFDELIEVKTIISQRYVEEADEKKLKEGALKGMVEALNDPYTVYVPPTEKREFNKDLTGEYVGIGAQVNTQTGWLVIVSPLEDSPAFRAGLMADDKVLEIDGKTTKDLSVEKCVELLSGQPGTIVKLLIERKGA